MATTETFYYTGSRETWTVPDNVETVRIVCIGASGGRYQYKDRSYDSAGAGGRVEGDLDVSPGDTLYIRVGEEGEGYTDTSDGSETDNSLPGGWPNGGNGGAGYASGASGGGSSDVRHNGDSLSDQVAVGGAGGGAGGSKTGGSLGAGFGGDGGGLQAEDGTNNTNSGGGQTSDEGYNDPERNQGSTGLYTSSTDGYAGGGGGGGYYGGVGGANRSDSSDTQGGGGGSGYYDGLTNAQETTGGEYGNGRVKITYSQKPATPNNPDATYVADDQVDFSFDEDTSLGDANEFEVQIQRDGGSWSDPAGGPSSPSSDGTYSYGPNSDTAYGRQVGIDSSFRFRVRASNGAGSSDWSYSDTVYTTPVPPINPSVSRPDANTVDLTVTRQSDIHRYYYIQFREDTGSGYGPWQALDAVSDANDGSAYSGSEGSKGDTLTMRFEADTTYQYENSFTTDSRVQFRMYSARQTPDRGVYATTSEWLYTDYGNDGNVYFEDGFESGDKSAWDGYYSGSGTVVQNPSNGNAGISSSEDGNYSLRIRGSDKIRATLPDLSDESDVIVKCAVASGSIDYDGEPNYIEFWDGSTWRRLRTFNHEYNRQGWVEVTSLVPNSYLGSENYVRFGRDSGGGGDYYYVDRVVVSDVLDEYTKPAPPSNIQLDPTTPGEITATWILNNSLTKPTDEVETYIGQTNPPENGANRDHTLTGYTFSNLQEGAKYYFAVTYATHQFRHGDFVGEFDAEITNNDTDASTVARLPLPGLFTADSVTDSAATFSWVDNASDETGYEVRARPEDEQSGFAFNGTDNYLNIGDKSVVNIVSSFSLSVRFKTTDPDGMLIHKQNADQSGYRTRTENGTIEFGVYGNSVGDGYTELNSAGTYDDDSTHYLTCTYDGSTMRILIDGIEDGSATQPTITSNGLPLRVGVGAADNYFNGDIYETAIHSKALTATEHNAMRSGDLVTDSLVHYLPLDENNSGTTPDMSGYGSDASVNGATLIGEPYDEIEAVAANSEQATLANLLNGEQYEAKLRVLGEDADGEVQ